MTSLLEIASDSNTSSDQLQTLAHTALQVVQEQFTDVALDAFHQAEVLEPIGWSIEHEICIAIAQHPNTSPETLSALFELFPLEVLQHPFLSLIQLERPNFLEELCRYDRRVYGMKGLPDFFIQWAMQCQNSSIRWKIAHNPDLALPVLESLAQDNKPEVRAVIASNPGTSITLLQQLAQDSDKRVRRCVAERTSLTIPVLLKLANDSNKAVRTAIARNPTTPPNILEQLSQDKTHGVRYCVASHPMTPTDVLTQLARDNHHTVHWGLAKNPNTPGAILEQLFEDERTHNALADNPNTPIHILKKLIQRHDTYICLKAARNLVARLKVELERG